MREIHVIRGNFLIIEWSLPLNIIPNVDGTPTFLNLNGEEISFLSNGTLLASFTPLSSGDGPFQLIFKDNEWFSRFVEKDLSFIDKNIVDYEYIAIDRDNNPLVTDSGRIIIYE